MTKRKIEVPPDDAPPQLDPAELVAARITEALGEDPTAMAFLQRQDPTAPDVWKYLRRFNPGEFDEEIVREQFGGGSYRIRIKNRKGQLFGGVIRFDIEGEPLRPEHGKPLVGTHPAAPASSGRDEILTAVLGMMGTIVASLAQRPAGPDPVALVREMATASAQSTERLAEMIGLRNEMQAGAKKGGDVAEALEILKTGMRIGRGMGDGSSGEGGTFGKLLEALDPLVKRIASAPQPGTQPPPAATPTTSGEPAPVIPPHLRPLVDGFGIIKEAALSGSRQPELYADLAVDRVPGFVDSLDAAIQEAGGVEALLTFAGRQDPAVVEHMAFFRHAVKYLTEEPDDAPPLQGGAEAE